ncbi:SpoIIE family protein phosphatase [Tautonia plasticadhaerens]|uniref:Phosphoserine phosphatase RsbU n=1 Tax=Tautonia plasticadhaerens TaxID=2527974 RepID=A0A518HAD3_9BACT|nr:SpoIIE family protein phosphatase [Tautonia plasticadhaerens]QDV37803.1 Phosphoserine phosphatase RsbU [Tautonia plasticadhaerens]
MSGGQQAAPSLRVQRTGVPERVVELKHDRLLIGRSTECDLVLEESTVSSRHARLTRAADGSFLLEDLDSRNNTFLDGRPIKGMGALRLADGQAFRICDYWLVFNGTRIRVEDEDRTSSSIRASVALGSSRDTPEPTRPGEALRAILEISRAVGSTLELDEVLDKLLEALFLVFPQADRGFVHLTDGAPVGRDLVPRRHRSRTRTALPYTISRAVVEEVLDQARAICCQDLPSDEKFAGSESLALSGIRTMVCAPILDRDRRPIGMLQLDARDRSRPFGAADLELLLAMLGPIGVAVENARLHGEILRRRQRDRDAQYAREVQRALVPEHPPRPPGYDFWHYYESAFEVGGDYFGYLPPAPDPAGEPGRCWAVSLGDVAGKGMPAALLMAKLSAEVQLALAAEPDPGRVLSRLNRRIAEAALPDSFITFVLLVLDVADHRLRVSGAGHPSPVIRRADGRLEPIYEVPQGPPLGVDPEARFDPVEVELSPGDLVVAYTDGATDAVDPTDAMFGTRALLGEIAGGPGSADALGPHLIEAITRFASGAPQADDITLLCFGRQGPGGPPPAAPTPPRVANTLTGTAPG